MGILKRIKGRVSSSVGLVKEGIQAIHEEASYPGKQPGFREAAEGTGEPLDRDMPEIERPVEDEAPGGGPFWFLDGENDGWEETNPGGSETQE
ncbi:MAG: hypothetical protein VX519_03420 [Myxococcota bacterium]|nr:hypothetical protein [Myxococcota bacterium]